jgi:hypothetical protein
MMIQQNSVSLAVLLRLGVSMKRYLLTIMALQIAEFVRSSTRSSLDYAYCLFRTDKAFYDVHLEGNDSQSQHHAKSRLTRFSRQTCGFRTFATQPTSPIREWTFIEPAMHGGTSERP